MRTVIKDERVQAAAGWALFLAMWALFGWAVVSQAPAQELDMPHFATEQVEGADAGLGLIDIVYSGELQLGDLASPEWSKQYACLLRLVEWAKGREADLFVLDDGHGARMEAQGTWSGKSTVTRWALDPAWEEPGALSPSMAMAALRVATGKPWAVYAWGDAPQGASAVYVACHNLARDRWFAAGLKTAKARGLPLVAQICPWRLIGKPPHPWLTRAEQAETLRWMAAREAEAKAAGVRLHWSIWTAEAGTNPQNSAEPQLPPWGVVGMTVHTEAALSAEIGERDGEEADDGPDDGAGRTGAGDEADLRDQADRDAAGQHH